MGAVAFVMAMGVVAVVGLALAGLGLVGTILFGIHKKKIGCGISVAVLVVGLVIAVLPVLLVGGILLENAKIPEDFQHTGIVIEENCYQPQTFTANGTVYHALPLEAHPDGCAMVAEAVFCYKPEGFLNRSQWGNYYRLRNDQGFDLIWDGYSQLYCPEDQTDAILGYYHTCGSVWMREEMLSLPKQLTDALNGYLENRAEDIGAQALETIPVEYSIDQCSADGLVIRESLWLGITENGVYDLTMPIYDANDQQIYYGIPMPDKISALLRQELETG